MTKLQPVALGVAFGVLGAVYIFIVGITAMFGWGVALIDPIATLYIGYSASFPGAIVGAIWGFFDGFIAGVVIAAVYNVVAR